MGLLVLPRDLPDADLTKDEYDRRACLGAVGAIFNIVCVDDCIARL